MYHVHIPGWVHQFPTRHDTVLRIEHLFHNSRFWGVLGLIALVALLIGLALLIEPGTESQIDTMPFDPFFP